MITLYGIPNCDTVKKARKWLEANGVDYTFHDFRKDGLTKKQVQSWAKQVGWETLLNRRGTSWRKLPEADRENITAARAVTLMSSNPTLIKRPVLDLGDTLHVGFSLDHYSELFA